MNTQRKLQNLKRKEDRMAKIDQFLTGVQKVAIAAHVNPDGDAVGSVMGCYRYLKDNYPDLKADPYLQRTDEKFFYLKDLKDYRDELDPEAEYDLLILLDISSRDRIGVAEPLVDKAAKTLCIDHHKTNRGDYTWLFNYPDMSSTSEALYYFLDPDKISESCAEALYMGIVHDTGIFQYSCTSPETLRTAARLMEKGIPFSEIVDVTFCQKTYNQNQIMGRAIMESILLCDGQIIVGSVPGKVMDFYGVTPKDMDGIVSQLRNTEGVEVAIFLYETQPSVWKVSLRSKEKIDVSKAAVAFGGGGHARAAGATMTGSFYDVVNNITEIIAPELGYPA